MLRFVLTAVLGIVALAWGQSRLWADDPPREEKQEPKGTVIKLLVTPQTTPKPALKYHLLPQLHEMHEGNAVQGYYRAYSPDSWSWTRRENLPEKLEKWREMPLDELPVRDAEGLSQASVFKMFDYAARSMSVDWQMVEPLRQGGFGTLLPDIQGLRNASRWLGLRARVAVKAKRFDDVIRTMKTILAISHHLGEHPSLIGSLVGMAIANDSVDRLDEMIQQTNAPNLFWAIAELPNPLVEYRRGIQAEVLMMNIEFGKIVHPTEVWTAEVMEEKLKKLQEVVNLGSSGTDKLNVTGWLAEQMAQDNAVKKARQRLHARGIPAERVAKMPPAQALILDNYHRYEVVRDEIFKLADLPFWVAQKEFDKVAEKYHVGTIERSSLIRSQSPEGDLFMDLVPALIRVRTAQLRVEQRLALLQHVEALRDYAATHEGKLPKKLDEIELPLPADPITGKPFKYTLEGNKAIIQGTPPKGMESTKGYNLRYEVTIRS